MVWKDIPGYEGLYQASVNGEIKSVGRVRKYASHVQYHKELILKPSDNQKGYLQCVLYKDGHAKTHKVHTLVAKTFVDNPYNLPIVNHKDKNKKNNSSTNLEWCDNKYNVMYSKTTLYRLCDPKGVEHTTNNLTEFCKQYGLTTPNLFKVLKGKRNHHKGWTILG